MAFLYRNKKGYEVTSHSYSGGADFRFCRRKYQLGRIDGWKEREKKAALPFGDAVESGIRFYHDTGCRPNSGVEEFTRVWDKLENDKELIYTEKEGSWEDMRQMGVEMEQLYEVWAKQHIVNKPKFQLNYKKEVYPGSHLAGINFTAYVDMVVEEEVGFGEKKAVIDIKTSATTLPETENLLMLDPQLRSYAWVTGIPDVGFLWFVKARPDSFRTGDTVTLLHNTTLFKAGEQAVVLSKTEETAMIVNPQVFLDYEGEAAEGKHTAAKLKAKWGEEGEGVHLDSITKQRLQFKLVHIPDEDIAETGQVIGQEIVDIVHAREKNQFWKEPGVRFPSQKCQFCSMLGICTNNRALRDEKLVNPNPNAWLEEFVESE